MGVRGRREGGGEGGGKGGGKGGTVQNIQEKLSASFTSGLDGATLPINFSPMELNISSALQPPIYTLMHVVTANQNDHKYVVHLT